MTNALRAHERQRGLHSVYTQIGVSSLNATTFSTGDYDVTLRAVLWQMVGTFTTVN
jgi:hypothetical protein